MKITIIHGQSHHGSTYHIAKKLAERLQGEITEFFLPKDFGEFCIGCTNCFEKSETLCPHYKKLIPITKAIDGADLIILASPVYVYHATGAMKALLDHYGYRWMVHRPEEKMFQKQAVCISTAAGAGMKSTNKDMADSLFFWGIGKIYHCGIRVQAVSYDQISEKIIKKIDKKIEKIAYQIQQKEGSIKPSIKTKSFFYVMRMLQKRGWNEADVKYWKDRKWDQRNRPWKTI